MPITEFPPHTMALSSGLLAIGGDLSVSSLLLAYRNGVFPWPHREGQILWFSPPMRTVLFFDKIRIPRSFRRALSQTPFTFRVNADFNAVIQSCSELQNREGQHGTWITGDIKSAYKDLFRAGYCYSFESWNTGSLAGGMYGVLIDRLFAGESMFYREPNASKVALIRAIEFLRERGITWMDCQMTTPLVESLGAVEIPRNEYLSLLSEVMVTE